MRPMRARGAFTMIELLIVVAILPVITFAVYTMVGRLEARGDQVRARMNATEEGSRALMQWRADVMLSARAEVGSGGQAMTIARIDAEGAERVIQYSVNTSGELQRKTLVPEAETRTLARNVAALEFEAEGTGFGAKLTIETNDGTRAVRVTQEAYSTPHSTAPAAGVAAE